MKRFLDNIGLKALIETIQKKYAENLQSSSTDANAGKFTYTIYKDKTGGGIEAEIKTIDTGANKVTIAEGSTSGAISVTTNGTTASVDVHNVLTSDTAQNISATKTVTTGNKLILVDAPSNDTDAVNKAYVDSMISASDAMVYKGTLGTDGTVTTLPTTNVTNGDTYKVITDGTYAGQTATVGDLFIAKYTDATPSVLEWTLIPSGKTGEVYLKYGTTVSGINDSEFKTGQIVLGDTVSKTVATTFNGNYSTDVSNNNNLPTVGAITAYAISGVTAGSGITVGAKTNGTQSVAVKVKANSGITSDTNGISANINENAGLEFDNTTGSIGITLAGSGYNAGLTFYNGDLKVDAGSGLIVDGKVKIDNGTGLTFDDNKLIVDLDDNSGLTFDTTTGKLKINTHYNGLIFDENDGSLKIETGYGLKIGDSQAGSGTLNVQVKATNPGLAVDGSGVSLKLDTTNANGLTITSSGLKLNTATTSITGAMSATDKTNLDNVKSTYAHSLTATTNSTAGVDLKLNDNSTPPVVLSTINVKGDNGASVTMNSGAVAVSAVANSVKGIAVSGSGIGINLKATDSGLAFNTGTGGDNGLYVVAITTQDIDAMWAGTYTA